MNENNIFPTTKLKIMRKVRIRRDDRPYHEGDFLKLKVYENGTFTGEKSICMPCIYLRKGSPFMN